MEKLHLGADDKRQFTGFLKGYVAVVLGAILFFSSIETLLAFYYRSVPEMSFVAFGAMVTSIVLALVAYGRTMLRYG